MIKQLPALVSELIALSFIIFAVVAWIKQLGLRGRWLTAAAFAFGLVFGLCWRYAEAPMTTFAEWFLAFVFGLMAGLLATGAYKAGESMTGKPSYESIDLEPGYTLIDPETGQAGL